MSRLEKHSNQRISRMLLAPAITFLIENESLRIVADSGETGVIHPKMGETAPTGERANWRNGSPGAMPRHRCDLLVDCGSFATAAPTGVSMAHLYTSRS